jgi:chromosomal replication initiation ATPase DnaA
MTGADGQEWKPVSEEVCALHGVSVQHLLSPRRGAALVSARQQCAKKLREAGLSLKRIGAILNRDHTSIIYLLRDRKPSGMEKATVEAAVADLCRKHGISIEELRSGRHAAMSEIRRECAEMLRSTGMTLDQIGRVLDRESHTVIRMLRRRTVRQG